MPTRKEVWTCKFCGAVSANKHLAETCEAIHIHADKLVVTNLVLHPKHSKYYYNAGNKMPSAIRVTCRGTDAEAVYVLKSTSAGVQIQHSTPNKL